MKNFKGVSTLKSLLKIFLSCFFFMSQGNTEVYFQASNVTQKLSVCICYQYQSTRFQVHEIRFQVSILQRKEESFLALHLQSKILNTILCECSTKQFRNNKRRKKFLIFLHLELEQDSTLISEEEKKKKIQIESMINEKQQFELFLLEKFCWMTFNVKFLCSSKSHNLVHFLMYKARVKVYDVLFKCLLKETE